MEVKRDGLRDRAPPSAPAALTGVGRQHGHGGSLGGFPALARPPAAGHERRPALHGEEAGGESGPCPPHAAAPRPDPPGPHLAAPGTSLQHLPALAPTGGRSGAPHLPERAGAEVGGEESVRELHAAGTGLGALGPGVTGVLVPRALAGRCPRGNGPATGSGAVKAPRTNQRPGTERDQSGARGLAMRSATATSRTEGANAPQSAGAWGAVGTGLDRDGHAGGAVGTRPHMGTGAVRVSPPRSSPTSTAEGTPPRGSCRGHTLPSGLALLLHVRGTPKYLGDVRPCGSPKYLRDMGLKGISGRAGEYKSIPTPSSPCPSRVTSRRLHPGALSPAPVPLPFPPSGRLQGPYEGSHTCPLLRGAVLCPTEL